MSGFFGWLSGSTDTKIQRLESRESENESKLRQLKSEKERLESENESRLQQLKSENESKVQQLKSENQQAERLHEAKLRELEAERNNVKEKMRDLEMQKNSDLKELNEQFHTKIRDIEQKHELERETFKDQKDKLEALQIRQQAEFMKQQEKWERELQDKQRKAEEQLMQKQQEFKEKLEETEAAKRKLEEEKQAAIDAKLAEPWRTFESGGSWTEEYQDQLVEDIKENKMPIELQVKDSRVLVLGSIKAGKSSFINSVASVDIGRLATPMLIGDTAKSITRQLKEYKPVNILKSFRILDTMGIEDREGEGFNVQDLVYLVQGNVLPHYKFNPRISISESDSEHFKKNPSLEDQVHCIVVVVDSNVVYSETIPDEAKKKIKELQNRVIDNNIPTVLLLTKIDELCDEVANDISTTFHSRKVYDAVVKAKDNFGVPEMNIFPVKCYSNETELKTNVNILILLALRKMMQMANDRLMMIPTKQSRLTQMYRCRPM